MNNFTLIAAAVGGALIGLAAVLLMMLTGRVAGISGIIGGLFAVIRHDTYCALQHIDPKYQTKYQTKCSPSRRDETKVVSSRVATPGYAGLPF